MITEFGSSTKGGQVVTARCEDKKKKTAGRLRPCFDNGPCFVEGHKPTPEDPVYDGVLLGNLRAGDLIRVKTALSGGIGLIIDMKLVNPLAAAVEITRVTQRTGFYYKNIGRKGIGVEYPVVVLRCSRLPERAPIDGWLGLSCMLNLSGGTTILQPIKTILINGATLFPQLNTTCH